MSIYTLIQLYSEFESECTVRNIAPSFDLFTLWAETTHKMILASNPALLEELALA